MVKSNIVISLIFALALPAAAGPYKDATDKAEKDYHDCIINRHQNNKTTDGCNNLHKEYLQAFDAYRNSDEYTAPALKSASQKWQTLESLQYRIERLERRMQDLERDLDSLRSESK